MAELKITFIIEFIPSVQINHGIKCQKYPK